MRRKIVRLGEFTLVASLPSKWVQKNKLKQGDEIEVREEKNNLVLSVEKSVSELVKEVSANKDSKDLSRRLNNLYRAGASKIIIRHVNPIVIKEINKNLPFMMGFEITEQEKNMTVLSDVMKVDENQFEQTLKRYFMITESLSKEAFEAATRPKTQEELEGILELEKIQNRLYMFLCRGINLKGDVLFNSPTVAYLLIQRLEDVADGYRDIVEILLDKKIKLSIETINYFKDVLNLQSRLQEFYFKFNLENGEEISIIRSNLAKKGKELILKSRRDELPIIEILNTTVSRIYETASPIYGLKM